MLLCLMCVPIHTRPAFIWCVLTFVLVSIAKTLSGVHYLIHLDALNMRLRCRENLGGA